MADVMNFFRTLCLNSFLKIPFLRKTYWKWWYESLARLYPQQGLVFMNYGYATLAGDFPGLLPEDTPQRHSIHLYHHLIAGFDLKNKSILEVGCGRGGGISYLFRYFHPNRTVGLDLSPRNIEFCRKQFNSLPISFISGSAEKLPFDSASFDLVLNVESSGYYPCLDSFFRETRRVLKPSGFFAICDWRRKSDAKSFCDSIEKSGFKILKKDLINSNIIRALDLISEERDSFICKNSPRWLIPIVREFAAIRGTKTYQAFQTGEMLYFSYLLQKPQER